jgi:di/tripeptidase|tara:strand:- start:39 stop:395 length:357 start_codon:yes stop_codon:yes gene_type:complete
MGPLLDLVPQVLWQLFDKICSIPHPSKHEQQISLWIKQWAKALKLVVTEDSVGNLLIKKPATMGMEERKGVILQAHMDMVSIGPTIKFPHSPDEKVEISSVNHYWQLLVAILANTPKQ